MPERHPDHDLIQGEWTERSLVEKLLEPVEKPPPRPWKVVAAVGFVLTLAWLYAIFVTFTKGLGTWGINQPVVWGFDIVHFVWWIGIGHAGTLISAILVLMRQNWRDSLNRITEAMTLFAVLCAATYPLIHMGRPQNFYWILPYPTHMALWPQYKSPSPGTSWPSSPTSPSPPSSSTWASSPTSPFFGRGARAGGRSFTGGFP